MAFLADQYAGEKGCWVEFFGRAASAHKAIALLALEHDALVAVCALPRLGRPMWVEMSLEGIDRSAPVRRRSRLGSRAYAVVYQLPGSGHPPLAGAILVAAPALERHAKTACRAAESGIGDKDEG